MNGILLDIVVKATLVLAAGCAAGFLLRRAAAALRHLLWTMVAAALLLLPAFEWALPVWEVRALPAGVALNFVAESRIPALPAGDSSAAAAAAVKPAAAKGT